MIVSKQHPITGLLPASTAVTLHGDYRDAWVRDNVYSILAVWGLGLAYRQLDDDGGRAFELSHRTVHLMRSLLRSMMAQSSKVQAFKASRHPKDALHAKYDTETGGPVVGDAAWGHLQIDATSLYLLTLTQMISSGLEIIWTDDEVHFIQNLVYYIERAYRTPDYGIWERGAKTNRGSVELNASSIGMAKAALEALSGFDLFGPHGSQASVVHVAPDNIAQADITLCSMLPRESNTKETDAALLSIIGYPAYAVQDEALCAQVRSDVIGKLEGRYGLKRFLRDGHQTVVEDEGRAHYEAEELKQFENVESEWPLFFAYLYLDNLLRGDAAEAQRYRGLLKSILVERNGQTLIPELYYVPDAAIEAERKNPGSQDRVANDNVPLVWAQSLYLLGRMLHDGVLSPSDIDPLGRRQRKLPKRPVVQLVFLAEDAELQAELAAHGVQAETPQDIAPVTLVFPDDIVAAYSQVGRNDRLGLTGRASRALKSLTTSRLFRLGGQTVVCLAPFFLQQEFFLAYDLEFLVRRFESELLYLHRHWSLPGRPLVAVYLTRDLLDVDRTAFYRLMRQIADGRVRKVPVRQMRLVESMPTACLERIDELHDHTLQPPELGKSARRSAALPEPSRQVPLSPAEEWAIELSADPEAVLLRLADSHNLYEQMELLLTLARLKPLEESFVFRGVNRTLSELVEEVYEQAGRLRLWAVVRQAAGLLGKVDGDLSLAVNAILIRQKIVQVGRAYSDDSLVVQPIPERELLSKITRFSREDIRDRVLTQEVLLYVSLLIKARPELFRDVLTIRLGHLTLLLSSQLARQRALTADEAYEALMHLPPSVVQSRLETVLERYHAIEGLPQELEQLSAEAAGGTLAWQQDLGLELLAPPDEGWLAWRQHRGIVDRRRKDFYSDVFEIFRHTQGLVIGDKLERKNRMESSSVLSDMTPGEQAFALWLEHLLNKIQTAEYRQLNLEALSVLSSFLRQNPTVKIHDVFPLDAMIGHAVRFAFVEKHPEHEGEYNQRKAEAWNSFYAASPAETSAWLVAALRSLLLAKPVETQVLAPAGPAVTS